MPERFGRSVAGFTATSPPWVGSSRPSLPPSWTCRGCPWDSRRFTAATLLAALQLQNVWLKLACPLPRLSRSRGWWPAMSSVAA